MRAAVILLCLVTRAEADVALPTAVELTVGTSVIAVEQNGKTLSIAGGVVRLKRAPFVFRFALPIGEGLLVHAWPAAEHYDRARAGGKLDEKFPFEGNGMAEELFNKPKELMLEQFAYSYWYYSGKSDHRFDQVKREGKRVIGRRSVERLVNLPQRGVSSPIAGTSYNPLYFVFVRTDGPKELGRGTLKLVFE